MLEIDKKKQTLVVVVVHRKTINNARWWRGRELVRLVFQMDFEIPVANSIDQITAKDANWIGLFRKEISRMNITYVFWFTYFSNFEKVGNFICTIEKFFVYIQGFSTLFFIHIKIFFYSKQIIRFFSCIEGSNFLPSKFIIPSLKAAYKRIRSLIKRKKQLLITPFVSSFGVT